MTGYNFQKFPASRIATLDIGVLSKWKHYVAAIELDVTESRHKSGNSSGRIEFKIN